MTHIFTIIFLLTAFCTIKAQYSGGAGDGYASLELNLTNAVNAVDAVNSVQVTSSNNKLSIQNLSFQDWDITISDIHGRIYLKNTIASGQCMESFVAEGIYFISVQNSVAVFSRKIILF